MGERMAGLLGDYRPVNERLKDAPGAVRKYLRKSLLLDSPEMTGSETAADIALGFVPGIGTAMAARDLERARRDDDYLGMALGAAGMVPVLGGAAKMVKKGGKKVAKVADYAPVRTAEEQAVLDAFGGKAVREAALQKKVQKAADNSAPEVVPTAAPAKKAKRQKVDADVYRKMAAEQGDDAVLAAVNRGEHLKPDGYGGYIGAPRTVDSPQALGAMRRSLDQQFSGATQAVAMADPDRLGTWYDRAKAGISMSAQPHQLDDVLDHHSVYSAGVSPEGELGFALKHLNSRSLGEPAMAYRGAPMRNLDGGRKSGLLVDGPDADYSGPTLGFKIGEYRAKNDPRVPNTGLFGVNDFRAAQGFGYTTPDGKIWKGGVSATMHPFMDGETALTVQRANKAQIGGRSDWQGPHLQELPWVYGKAQDLYGRGKNARFKGDELEGVSKALREANNTASDYFYKHTGAATHEAIPGASTGHVPSMLDAPFQEKIAYGQQGRWDVPSAYSLADAPGVGAGNQDAIYSAMGLRQLPSIPSSGAYRNSQGVMENNPVTVARPMLDFPTGGGGRVAELTREAMNAAERYRAVIDAQEAGAWNLPVTANAVKGKNAMVLDSRAADATTGRQPTLQEMQALTKAVDDSGYGVTATSRGVSVFPYDLESTPADLRKFMKARGAQLEEAFPGASAQNALMSSGYVPGIGKFDAAGNIVPTAPYSGEATMGLLSNFAQLPPSVARNLSESEQLRGIIRQKVARDGGLLGARGDIQNTRNFLADADWNRAVDMIRKGAAPAAALSALGYSASSLAADE